MGTPLPTQQHNINNNNNNVNNKPVVEDITYRKQAIQTFIKIFVNKYGSNGDNSLFDTDQWLNKDKENNPYRTEIGIIQKLNSEGVKWGIGATIISFVFLRKGPVYLINYMARRRQNNKMNFPQQQQQPPPSASSFYHQQAASVAQQQAQQQVIPSPPSFKTSGGKFWTALWLVFDLGLSIWCGTMFSFSMTDKKRCLEGIADMPLVEGKSMLSEQLCTDFITKYKTYPNQLWKYSKDHKDEEDVDLWLFSIHRFVQNCKRRQAYEQSLIKEVSYDLSSSSGQHQHGSRHPIVPPPGVPTNFSIDENDGVSNDHHHHDDGIITNGEIDNFLNDFPDEMKQQSDFNADNDSSTTTWKAE